MKTKIQWLDWIGGKGKKDIFIKKGYKNRNWNKGKMIMEILDTDLWSWHFQQTFWLGNIIQKVQYSSEKNSRC